MMSAFFDVPSAGDQPVAPQQRYRSQPWHGPPPAVIPAVVAVERVLAATDAVAVTITALQVYPAGIALEVITFSSLKTEERIDDGFDPMVFHHPHIGGAGVSDDVLRMGVAFADGRKGTNLVHELHLEQPPRESVVFRAEGGGGGGGRWAQAYWMWPIPDRGPLTVVCEWPSFAIPETRMDIDGDEIRAASKRAQVVFSEDHLPEPPDHDPGGDAVGGWNSYTAGG